MQFAENKHPLTLTGEVHGYPMQKRLKNVSENHLLEKQYFTYTSLKEKGGRIRLSVQQRCGCGARAGLHLGAGSLHRGKILLLSEAQLPAGWRTLDFGFPREVSTAILTKLIVLPTLQAGGICSCGWERQRNFSVLLCGWINYLERPSSKICNGIRTIAHIKSGGYCQDFLTLFKKWNFSQCNQ